MPEAFQEGQVVELKSGGPAMTVHTIDGVNAICRWFAGTNLKEHRFTMTTLEPSQRPSKPATLEDLFFGDTEEGN